MSAGPAASAPSANIAALLDAQAAARPYQRAVVFPQGDDGEGHVAWTQLSFKEAHALADAFAHGLVEAGVRRGDRVSLMVKPCLDFMPLVFAVFKVGALPVLIDPGMGKDGFLRCFERIRPRVLIGEAVAHVIRQVYRRAFKSVEIGVTRGAWSLGLSAIPLSQLALRDRGPFETAHAAPSDEAAILFTSGSTGPAKGVTYTHGIFQAQTRHIQAMYGIEGGEIELACFPLFGLFSLAMGMTVVIPDMDPTRPAEADPETLVRTLEAHGCTSAFGSPTLWKGVARYCLERGLRLPSLRRILMAGAPVPIPLHEAFAQILEGGAEIHTPYGATESLPVASIASREVLGLKERSLAGAGICVGRPAPEVCLRIIEVTDEPLAAWGDVRELPPGEIGEITVRGPVVTHEYKELPEDTALAKVADGDAVVHRIGDVGYLDAEGRLWFCGRKSHRLRLKDGSARFTVPSELLFNAHPQVSRTALVAVDGEPVLVVEKEAGATMDDAALRAELRAIAQGHPLTRDVERFYFHPAFPVDVRHNAKIHRPQLAEWAAKQRGDGR